MNAVENLEQRIKDKLAEHQSVIDDHQNQVSQQMVQVDRRHQEYVALAERLTKEVIRPQLEKLASFFDNAVVLEPEDSRHVGVCVFKHTNRFPARARLELGLSCDPQAADLVLSYRIEILPIFFDFPKCDDYPMPLDATDDGKVAEWFQEKIVAFLDAYLRLETHDHYQADNVVTDVVCGMPVNKLHAAAQMDYRGVTYFFCIDDCRKKFAADPESFMLGHKGTGASRDPASLVQQ